MSAEPSKKHSKAFARGFLDRQPKVRAAAKPVSEPRTKSAAKPPQSQAVREQTAFLDRVVERPPPTPERRQTSEARPDPSEVQRAEQSVSGPLTDQSKPAKLSRFKQQRMQS